MTDVRSDTRFPCGALALSMVLCLGAAACAQREPVSGAELGVMAVEPELRIGSVDDPGQSLTFVGQIAVDEGGAMYVAQPQENLIRVFSPVGDPLTTIGRAGEGPGEFRSVGALGWLGDTLYVTDRSNRRVSSFSKDGAYLGSLGLTSPPVDDMFSPSVPTRMLADGTALVLPSFPSRLISDGTITARPFFRIDREGNVLSRFAEASIGNSQLSIERGTGGLFSSQPFGDGPLTGVAPSGEYVVIVDRAAATEAPGTMWVRAIGIEGDTLFDRSLSYQPDPITDAQADSTLDSLAEQLAGSPVFSSAREAREALEEAAYVPAYRPPASSVAVGSDGLIWIRRRGYEGPDGRWDVLSSEGEPLGRVFLPASAAVRESRDGLLWTTETDDLEIPYVVRYRVTGGA